MTNLNDVTARLGLYYDQWKKSELEKNKHRDAFFLAVSNVIGEGVAAERLAEVGAATEEEARERLSRQFPDWTVDAIHQVEGNRWEAIMVENPDLQPYTFVNGGRVFQRQIATGSPMLDDERLAAENPELWKRVTTVPYGGWIKNVMYHCGVDGNDIEHDFDEYLEILADGPKRTLRPLEELDDDTLAELQDYVYYGKPTVRLSIRKAKPEELE